MIVYVITSGEGVEAVALEKEKAEELEEHYSNVRRKARIEVYDTDDYYIEKGRFYEVIIRPNNGIEVRERPYIIVPERNKVLLTTAYTTPNTEYLVRVKAKDEQDAKKIAWDLVAEFRAQEQRIWEI